MSLTTTGAGANADGTAIPPFNTVPPLVTGTPQQGQQLSSTMGTWLRATVFTYQWQRSADGISWSNIALATSQKYVLKVADVGKYVRSVVTAANGGGSTSANSNSVGPIT